MMAMHLRATPNSCQRRIPRHARRCSVHKGVVLCSSKRGPSLESRLPYLSEPSFANDLFDLKVGQVDSIGVRLGLCVAHGGLVVGGRQSGVARASWITLFHKSTQLFSSWGGSFMRWAVLHAAVHVTRVAMYPTSMMGSGRPPYPPHPRSLPLSTSSL